MTITMVIITKEETEALMDMSSKVKVFSNDQCNVQENGIHWIKSSGGQINSDVASGSVSDPADLPSDPAVKTCTCHSVLSKSILIRSLPALQGKCIQAETFPIGSVNE